jgi:futalosine hydrolase
MKVLLIAATENEINPFLLKFPACLTAYYSIGKHDVKVLITGAGILATSYAATKEILENSPELVLNVGICGSIDATIPLGSVLKIETDCLGDFGAESADGFIRASAIGLLDMNEFPFKQGLLYSDTSQVSESFDSLKKLHSVNGITVQKVHGEANSIDEVKTLYPKAQVESMEGAAVFYVSKKLGIKCAQIRSVSNYVEVRNRDAWDVPKAIKHLNEFLIELF